MAVASVHNRSKCTDAVAIAKNAAGLSRPWIEAEKLLKEDTRAPRAMKISFTTNETENIGLMFAKFDLEDKILGRSRKELDKQFRTRFGSGAIVYSKIWEDLTNPAVLDDPINHEKHPVEEMFLFLEFVTVYNSEKIHAKNVNCDEKTWRKRRDFTSWTS